MFSLNFLLLRIHVFPVLKIINSFALISVFINFLFVISLVLFYFWTLNFSFSFNFVTMNTNYLEVRIGSASLKVNSFYR